MSSARKLTVIDSSQAQSSLRVRKSIEHDSVRWGAVIDLISSRHRIPYADASKLVRHFIKRLDLIFNLAWFLERKLSAAENRLAFALCEVHGADELTISSVKTISAGLLSFSYRQRVEISPGWSRAGGETGRCRGQIDLRILGNTLSLTRPVQVLLTQGLLFSFAVAVYVLLVGAFLHGFAAFILLLEAPTSVTIAATNRLEIMLSLLCFLVGSAGIFGRAIRNAAKGLFRVIQPR